MAGRRHTPITTKDAPICISLPKLCKTFSFDKSGSTFVVASSPKPYCTGPLRCTRNSRAFNPLVRQRQELRHRLSCQARCLARCQARCTSNHTCIQADTLSSSFLSNNTLSRSLCSNNTLRSIPSRVQCLKHLDHLSSSTLKGRTDPKCTASRDRGGMAPLATHRQVRCHIFTLLM